MSGGMCLEENGFGMNRMNIWFTVLPCCAGGYGSQASNQAVAGAYCPAVSVQGQYAPYAAMATYLTMPSGVQHPSGLSTQQPGGMSA